MIVPQIKRLTSQRNVIAMMATIKAVAVSGIPISSRPAHTCTNATKTVAASVGKSQFPRGRTTKPKGVTSQLVAFQMNPTTGSRGVIASVQHQARNKRRLPIRPVRKEKIVYITVGCAVKNKQAENK